MRRDTSFQDDSFDRILVGGVAHMTTPRRAFEESYRVLRNRGGGDIRAINAT
ncbi:MAG: hypothetical protein DRN19_04430 [Thermoplasmata archaeon]|nr:MAG: hypothetical protein DRN19_04430 [Thermoplasmata archaeon]